MNNRLDVLPQDIIKLLFTSLSIQDMSYMGMSNKQLYKLYQEENLWSTIVGQKYPEFINIIDKNGALALVRYLSLRRIIPIYEDKIIGYLIVSFFDTVDSLYNLLRYVNLLPQISSLFPKTISGLPIVELKRVNTLLDINETSPNCLSGVAVMSTPGAQLGFCAVNDPGVLVAYPVDKRFANMNKNTYYRELLVNEYLLIDISLCKWRIYPNDDPQIESSYNFFNSLDLIYIK